MPITLPTAHDAVEEARRIVDSMIGDFRKYPDPNDVSPPAQVEQAVLSSVSVLYYTRPASKNYDNTIAVALIDSQDSMPYMDLCEAVLQRLKSDFFWDRGSDVFRRDVNQWAFSWNDEKDDD